MCSSVTRNNNEHMRTTHWHTTVPLGLLTHHTNLHHSHRRKLLHLCVHVGQAAAPDSPAKQAEELAGAACGTHLCKKHASNVDLTRFDLIIRAQELCRKKPMARHLAAMSALAPQHYSFSPRTFVLPADLQQLLADARSSKRRKQTYILKPDAGCQVC